MRNPSAPVAVCRQGATALAPSLLLNQNHIAWLPRNVAMLVPRSFKYSSAPVASDRSSGEHHRKRSASRKSVPHDLQKRLLLHRPESPIRTYTEPVFIPSPKTATNDPTLIASKQQLAQKMVWHHAMHCIILETRGPRRNT